MNRLSRLRSTPRVGGMIWPVLFLLTLAGTVQAAVGSVERVRLGAGGEQANKASTHVNDGPNAISSDGRFVVFVSLASNLVPGDTNRALVLGGL